MEFRDTGYAGAALQIMGVGMEALPAPSVVRLFREETKIFL